MFIISKTFIIFPRQILAGHLLQSIISRTFIFLQSIHLKPSYYILPYYWKDKSIGADIYVYVDTTPTYLLYLSILQKTISTFLILIKLQTFTERDMTRSLDFGRKLFTKKYIKY